MALGMILLCAYLHLGPLATSVLSQVHSLDPERQTMTEHKQIYIYIYKRLNKH